MDRCALSRHVKRSWGKTRSCMVGLTVGSRRAQPGSGGLPGGPVLAGSTTLDAWQFPVIWHSRSKRCQEEVGSSQLSQKGPYLLQVTELIRALVSPPIPADRQVLGGSAGQVGPTRDSRRASALYPSRRLLSARLTAFLQFLKQTVANGMPDGLAAYVGKWQVRASPLKAASTFIRKIAHQRNRRTSDSRNHLSVHTPNLQNADLLNHLFAEIVDE